VVKETGEIENPAITRFKMSFKKSLEGKISHTQNEVPVFLQTQNDVTQSANTIQALFQSINKMKKQQLDDLNQVVDLDNPTTAMIPRKKPLSQLA